MHRFLPTSSILLPTLSRIHGSLSAYSLLHTAYFLLCLVLVSCGGLRIERSIIVRPGDVLTYGGNNQRTADYDSSIPDSLVEYWEKDLSAGMGSGSPLLLDSMVVGGSLRGELYAINIRTGKLVGSIRLDDATPGSPAIDANVVVLPMSGGNESMEAYNLNDGRTVWRKKYEDVEMSPLLIAKRVYFGTIAGSIYCIERISGDVVWKYELPDNRRFNGFHALPAANDSLLFFGCDDGSLYALRISDGALRWNTPVGGPIVGGTALMGDDVVATTLPGSVIAINPATGAIRWTSSTGSALYAPPAVCGDTVVVGGIDGIMHAIDGRDGKEIWKTNLDGPVNAGAAIAGGKVFVGTLKKIFFALSLADGHIIFSKELDGRVKSPAVVGYERVFVTTDEFTLFCFGKAAR